MNTATAFEQMAFQPTLPARGATGQTPEETINTAFQPTLPARGATRVSRKADVAVRFQPTLPARGATSVTARPSPQRQNFNPHSPHGERRACYFVVRRRKSDFNPHSPHGERLQVRGRDSHRRRYFNPHSPHGERHARQRTRRSTGGISTHTPRTGSDADLVMAKRGLEDFNPHSPHGERHGWTIKLTTTLLISTHTPRTGSDTRSIEADGKREISTHTPRTGSDDTYKQQVETEKKFQPTLPARGATDQVVTRTKVAKFQPTLPARGATAQSNNSVDQNQRLCTKSIP